MSTASKILWIACVAGIGLVAVWTLADTESPIDARDAALELFPPTAVERDELESPAIPTAPARATNADTDVSPVRADNPGTLPAVAADDCCIVGRVVDAQGNPIVNANLTANAIEPDDGALLRAHGPATQPVSATSREDGSFEVPVPGAQAFALKAAYEKLAPSTRAPVFAGESVDMILTAGGVLRVRVRSLGGDPNAALAGARVTAKLETTSDTETMWEIEGDAGRTGEAVFRAVPAGVIEVRARAPGLASARATVQSSGSGEITCELLLAVPGVIEGTVVESATGVAIVGAKVGCGGLGWTFTDREGGYKIADVAPGNMTYGVGASAPGYAIAHAYMLVEASGERRQLNFALDTAQRARGRVVNATGAPIARARVSYVTDLATAAFLGETHRGEASTDAEGRFELADLHADAVYRLLVHSDGYGSGAFSAGPFARGSDDAELGDLVLASPASIAGEVRCRTTSDERSFVRLVWLGDEGASPPARLSHFASAEPDRRGRFAFRLLSLGSYRVELVVRPAGGGRSNERIAALESLELAAGEARSSVVLECASTEISGRVVDNADRGIGGCRVSLFESLSRDTALATSTTDVAGKFRMLVDAEGPFRLEASDPRLFYESAAIDDVRPGDGELALVLGPFRSTFVIRGRLVDSSGEVPANLYVAFRDTQTNERLARVALPDALGRFEMRDLRDVAYDLELMDFKNRYKPAKLANVKPSGEDVELRIEPRE